MKIFLTVILFFNFLSMCGSESLKLPAQTPSATATPNNADQTALPPTIPAGIEIRYTANFGMTPAYRKIVVRSGEVTIESKEYVAAKKNYVIKNQTVKITADELARLYQSFVENRFDTIKNDERKGIVYDAPGENIYLKLTDQDYFQKSYGDNQPMSGDNLRRYQTVRAAIFELSKKDAAPAAPKLSGENMQIFEYDPAKFSWVIKDAKPAALEPADLTVIETAMRKAVAEYNAGRKSPGEKIKDLKIYKRQLVPYLNPQGEKEVWVNCLCHENGGKWRTEIMGVDDGGSCYFNLKINLNSKKVYDLMVNGIA